jgi:hypothetical protein
MKVIGLISQARGFLQDIRTPYRWSNDELLAAFNAAQLAIAQHRTDEFSAIEEFTCVNSSRQTLVAGQHRLLEVIGNTGGGSIVKTTRKRLDALVPGWREEAADAESPKVELYIYEERNPKVFYVYPVPPVDHSIEVSVEKLPAVISIADFNTDTQTVELGSEYHPIIVDYMLHRAYSKDSNNKASMARGRSYLDSFNRQMGIKQSVEDESVKSDDGGSNDKDR